MNGACLATAGRIHQELIELDRVLEWVGHIWSQRQHEDLPPEPEYVDFLVDAVALNLHGIYAGIERILELIADTVDQSKPSGALWHRDLLQQLQQMTAEIPGVRPPVLSLEARNRLDRYRGFRHVVRNIYTFSLDVEQVEPLMDHFA